MQWECDTAAAAEEAKRRRRKEVKIDFPNSNFCEFKLA